MKILITGATGLVGKQLVKQLLSEGHQINFLTSRKEAVDSLPNCTGFYWVIEKGSIDIACIKGVDKIIHLAGASVANRWTKKYKKEIIDSRVIAAQLLFKTLKENSHSVNQIVSASAIGLYQHSYDSVYDEEATDFSNGFLGEVVRQWELSADTFSGLNIKVTKVRIGVVLAHNGGALRKMAQPISLGFGTPLASGKQYMSWIHINDLTQLIVFLLENNKGGVFNGVAPNPVTNSVLTKAIAKQLNKSMFLPNLPKFLLQLLLGEMHKMVCDSQKVSSLKIEKAGFVFQFKTLEDSLKDLL